MGQRVSEKGTVGALVRQAREEAGLTVDDLARRSGCGRANIYRIEGDDVSPSVSTLERIARALHVGVRDLIPAGPSRR